MFANPFADARELRERIESFNRARKMRRGERKMIVLVNPDACTACERQHRDCGLGDAIENSRHLG